MSATFPEFIVILIIFLSLGFLIRMHTNSTIRKFIESTGGRVDSFVYVSAKSAGYNFIEFFRFKGAGRYNYTVRYYDSRNRLHEAVVSCGSFPDVEFVEDKIIE